MTNQLNLTDLQRWIGALYVENQMLREALAKTQQNVRLNAEPSDTGGRRPGDEPGRLDPEAG